MDIEQAKKVKISSSVAESLDAGSASYSGLARGASLDDDDDDGLPMPVRIMREYWGPTSGRHAYSQRLVVVLFTDKKKVTMVAEDVVDGVDEPFEENAYYTSVLREWRIVNSVPPPRPI